MTKKVEEILEKTIMRQVEGINSATVLEEEVKDDKK